MSDVRVASQINKEESSNKILWYLGSQMEIRRDSIYDDSINSYHFYGRGGQFESGTKIIEFLLPKGIQKH